MPEQMNLDQTPADIVKLTCAYLSTLTQPLGNAALSVVMSNEKYRQGMAALNEAALSGELEATKIAGRELIAVVKEMLDGQ